jgi:hypothetical protein
LNLIFPGPSSLTSNIVHPVIFAEELSLIGISFVWTGELWEFNILAGKSGETTVYARTDTEQPGRIYNSRLARILNKQYLLNNIPRSKILWTKMIRFS